MTIKKKVAANTALIRTGGKLVHCKTVVAHRVARPWQPSKKQGKAVKSKIVSRKK